MKRKRKRKNRAADRGAAGRYHQTQADILAHTGALKGSQQAEGKALLPCFADTLLNLYYQTLPSEEPVEYLVTVSGFKVTLSLSRLESGLSVQATLHAASKT